ncbi:hypothetical protein HCN44_008959 [Aphidius gifuensis]|uniref:SSD domain-containing protein n=1 Tax=Aphidius gifuensis TaxID=684658 RepID=A0A834XQK2_APHGI|nr:hypothetical protein HCN44_008959 [Aphidius gifuensis]
MVSASGPTGILAGRPSQNYHHRQQQQEQQQQQYMENVNDEDERINNNDKIKNEENRLRHESDLYIRPSWTDAAIALDQLEKGKAEGQRSAVWIRASLQDELSQLGYFLQRHAGKVIFVAIIVLATFIVALKSGQVHTKVEQLWIQEGGRLEKELEYTIEVLGEVPSTHQLVIQTPKYSGANLLNPNALIEHLNILTTAIETEVQLFDVTWTLRDMCHTPAMPIFEGVVAEMFTKIVPCAIMTPLDCFWEGSKLIDYAVAIPGPKHSQYIRWTSLNPTEILHQMKNAGYSFPFELLEDYMKRAGVTNGYQTKPCLDPYDPACPDTAPNKLSKSLPDVGTELAGGCYGFAANYMHWPEELLVGGVKRNKSGSLTRASGLQSIVQLNGEREFYERYDKDYRTQDIDWSQEKASHVLQTWQRAFTNSVKKQMNANRGLSMYNMYTFSTTTMNDILGSYSKVSVKNISIGCGFIVAIGGVLLTCASVVAGLGFCALLGIPFNAITTQIIPFLALGLGLHDMFLLTHTYAELDIKNIPSSEQTGIVLKRTGLSVILKSSCVGLAFFAASLIPIPALRMFSIQAGILIFFNLGSIILVFPTMVSLDLRRRRSGRSDILCCCLPALNDNIIANNKNLRLINKNISSNNNNNRAKQTITRAMPPDRRQTQTKILTNDNDNNESWVGGNNISDIESNNININNYHNNNNNNNNNNNEMDKLTGHNKNHDDCLLFKFSLTKIASKHYAPFVTNSATKFFGMLIFVFLLAASVWQSMKVIDGFELTDLVPRNSDEYAFLLAQSKHFGVFNMYAVTGRDFDYPHNQKLLYEYHDSFIRIKNIIKNDDGGLPKFWLMYFRDWLKNLQNAFDKDYRSGCIDEEKWCSNATDDAILAYKLLVQTGHADNPIDKFLISRNRLVDNDGIINPRGFYNYLTSWATNDAFAYETSQGNLRPLPKEQMHDRRDVELIIKKSSPLTYAQMPFFLQRLTDTNSITQLISGVREVCEKFEERGLPNFPSGIPFLFWEQYMDLRSCLGIALLAALGASFAVVGILLLNFWAALLVVISLAGVVLQLFGVMGFIGMKLSAVPAVLLVVSVGIAVHFNVHICLSFVTSVGGRDRRVRLALEHMFAPIIHGAITTLIAVMMLAFSEFEFVIKYFFLVLLCLIGIGLVNGLFFFPILLSLIGPSAEVIPYDQPDRISTPTPPPSPKIRRSKPPAPPRRPHKIDNRNLHNEPSLTTITEESNSWNSAQDTQSCIIVQPEVKIETTSSTCGNQNCGGSDSSGSSQTSPVTSTPHITTKVTATANIKVEVHTPLSNGGDRGDKYRHSSSNGRRSTRCSANINAESSCSSSEQATDNVNVKHK